MPSAVFVSGLSGYGGQLGQCFRLDVGVSDGAGEGLGVGGQPGRAVRVSCPGGVGGKRSQRLGAGDGFGDGAGFVFGAI